MSQEGYKVLNCITGSRYLILFRRKKHKTLFSIIFLGFLTIIGFNLLVSLNTRNTSKQSFSFAPGNKEVMVLPNQDISRCRRKRKEAFGITMADIHSINPYENFAPQIYGIEGPDATGWQLDRVTFDKVLNVVKPKFMVEVGSWKGLSAIYFAKKMREMHGPDACLQLICIDTWLGTTVAWESKDMDNPEFGNTLHLRNGYPSVYYQFLYNMIDHKVDDIVIPLPLPGVMGSIFLQRHHARPDTVYIDGCHDHVCVLQDLESWFPLIAVNGIIMGDDFGRVKGAVAEFCTDEHNCVLDKALSTARTFVLRKTA